MPSNAYPWDAFRNNLETDPHLCFIAMPLRPEFAGPRQAIEEIGASLGYRCVRADDIQRPGVIHADIWEHIQRAGIVVADITDLNPNVILEVGVAAAIKEQFRLVLLVKSGSTAPVPFDLAPFRHIRYEDSMKGSKELRERLSDSMRYALSEAGAVSSLLARAAEWEKADFDYGLLISSEALARTRNIASLADLPAEVRSYLLAAAVQHGASLNFWIRVNLTNEFAADSLINILQGPHVRPQYRAAYALQHLAPALKARALAVLRGLSLDDVVRTLVDSTAAEGVDRLVDENPNGVLSPSERHELLQSIREPVRVRVSRTA